MTVCFSKQSVKVLLSFIFVTAAWFGASAQSTFECDGNCAGDCAPAAGQEVGCSCFDEADNDGDGKIDINDPNCASFYGLGFAGNDGDCPGFGDGNTGEDPFSLVDDPITSSQNTADTQSKVSVGDVDGDGDPDAVITSKWNSEIRVVATSGASAGDVISAFKTTGQGAKFFEGTGGCDRKNLLFEHENLIADIDGDGKAELFGIVSNRGGNPSSPPTCFYLMAWTYVIKDLQPLYAKAIAIGSDRPGTFGIADMDGDGKAELYIRDRIYAAESGVLLAQASGNNWDKNVVAAPAAVNLTGDSKLELVTGTKIYSIPSLSNRNPGTPATLTLWKDMNDITTNDAYVKLMLDPVEYGTDTHSAVSVADIDNDNNIDVVITGALGSENGKTAVFYWNIAKEKVSYYLPIDPDNANGWPWGTGRVNLIDTDKDGLLDMFFIAGNRLYRLETIGETFSPTINSAQTGVVLKTINDSRSGVITVTVYDFDNDGNFELAYRDSQELAVIDAATLSTKYWSASCQSHTYTEGPIIADVNGDGGTDICVPCNTNNSFDIQDPIQQQALGQFRLYYSSGNDWLPTRDVWNQPGYFVVNINDDLTLPYPQVNQLLEFGDEDTDCGNGSPGGIQQPLNVFLNQVPFLNAEGCPVFPAPDIAFYGDDPDNPGVDSNGDGSYLPAVEIVPPVCGDDAIKVRFNITNSGSLPITDAIPVSFFVGDPREAGVTNDSLIHSYTINVTNLDVDEVLTTDYVTFNGPGTAFRLYVVLDNDGSTLPVDLSEGSSIDCSLDNNIYDGFVDPLRFEVRTVNVQDNQKCSDLAANNGALEVQVWRNGAKLTDLSAYAFQWYTGPTTAPVIINGATTTTLTNLAEGIYSVQGINTQKGCLSTMVQDTVDRIGIDFSVDVDTLHHQTVCNPADGSLQAIPSKLGNYLYEWFDKEQNSLGVFTSTITQLPAGNYTVKVTQDCPDCTLIMACFKTVNAGISEPELPEGFAESTPVIDCSQPNTGTVSAVPTVNGVVVPEADRDNLYDFDWYYYNNVTATRSTALPVAHGTGYHRTALPVGFYEVVITDKSTNCSPPPVPPIIVEIKSELVIPTVDLVELTPQTSCDPANPNGMMEANPSLNGAPANPADFTFEWFEGDNTLPANRVLTGIGEDVKDAIKGGGIFYTVKVTTANNCSATDKLVITEDINVPVITLTETPNSICDDSKASSPYNGTMTAAVTFDGTTVTLPNANYQFTWHDGTLTTDPTIAVADNTLPTLSQLDGGSYTVTVERVDFSCVSLPQTKVVTETTTLPVISMDSIASTNCVGGTPNGQLVVAGVVPADTYSYRWFTAANVLIADEVSASLDSLQGGMGQNYAVEVTLNSTGCVSTRSTNVPDGKASPLLLLDSADNAICDAALGFTGSAFQESIVDANGVVGDSYTFAWSTGNDMTDVIGGQITNTLNDINGGFYTATATNNRTKCTSDPRTIEVENNQILPAISPTPVPSTNCGWVTANGEIEVDITNAGAETYNYAFYTGNLADPAQQIDTLTNQGANVTQTGLQGGIGVNYTIAARNNATGCTNTFVQVLTDGSEQPVISLDSVQNVVCDIAKGFTGEITVADIDGLNELPGDPYSYDWSTGNTMATPIAVADTTVSTLTGLDGGLYTVTATNTRSGCTSTPVTIQVTESTELPDIDPTPVPSTNCDANHNGEIQVALTNAGTDNFTFLFRQGNTLAGTVVTTFTTTSNTAHAIELDGGLDYFIQATNETTGCVGTYVQALGDGSEAPVVSLDSTVNSVCDAAFNFNGAVTVVGIDGPNEDPADTYGYHYYTGNTTASEIAADTTLATLGELDGGLYTVVARNNRLGCSSDPVTIQVTENIELPDLDLTPTPSTNCDDNHNGEIEVALGNAGTHNFIFLFRQGNTLAGTPVTTFTATSNTAHAIELDGGLDYFIQATNQTTGCVGTIVQALADDSEAPVISLDSTVNVTCDVAYGFTGAVTIVDIDGPNEDPADTYGYHYFTGNTTAAEIATADTTLATLGALDGGLYTVVARNNRLGCSSNPVTIQVTEDTELPDLDPTPEPSTNCDANHNGEIQVALTNAGTDDFTFFFAQGNTAAGTTVTTFTFTTQTAHATELEGGLDYFIQAKNETTGCIGTFVQTLADDSEAPVISLDSAVNTTCDVAYGFTGAVSVVDIDGPNEDPADTYGYHYFTGNTTATEIGTADTTVATLGQLDGALYTVVARNNRLGCSSDPVTIQVTEDTELPDLDPTPEPSTNCDANHNGEIQVALTNAGTDDFTFLFRQGNTLAGIVVNSFTFTNNTAHATDLEGGLDYFIQAKNETTGCIGTFVQTLADDSEAPVISLDSTVNVTCDVAYGFTGAVTVVDVDGANEDPADTYGYHYFTGNTTASEIGTADTTVATLGQLDGGLYTVVARNNRLGCSSNPVTIQVTEDVELPIIDPTPTPSTNCDDNHNGEIAVVITNDGTDDFTFFFAEGNTAAGTTVTTFTVTTQTANVTELEGGLSYYLQAINDRTGCVGTYVQALSDDSEAPVISLDSTVNVTCDVTYGFTGAVTVVDIDGANEDPADTYGYHYFTGNTTASEIGTADTTLATLTALDGGLYTVVARNNRLGCSSNPVTIQVTEDIELPIIDPDPTPSTNCDANHNGEIEVALTNAASDDYTFDFRKGNLITSPAVTGFTFTNNTAHATDLEGGFDYFIHVINDRTGCVGTYIQTLADNSEVPVLTLDSTQNVTCDEDFGFTGTVFMDEVTGQNEVAGDPYSYKWSTGSDMTLPIAVADTTNSTLSNLDGGFYTATVRNNRLGCVSNPVTIRVTESLVLPDLTTAATHSTNCAPAGAANGSIVATIGTPAGDTYEYTWYTGATATAGSEIGGPITGQGATATLSNRQGGTNIKFTIKAINERTGCESVVVQALNDESVLPTFTLNVTDNGNCSAPWNGTANITGLTDPKRAGTNTYKVEWWRDASAGAAMTTFTARAFGTITTNADIDALESSFYFVRVTNEQLGCASSIVNKEVKDVQVLPVISLTPEPSTHCAGGNANGEIFGEITNQAGTETYNFEWYQNTTVTGSDIGTVSGVLDHTLTGLEGDLTYLLFAENDSTRCTSTKTVFLMDDSEAPVINTLAEDPNENCEYPWSGKIRLNETNFFSYRGTNINALAGFTVVWDSVGTTIGNNVSEVTGRGAATYSVRITANGTNPVTNNNDACFAIANVTVLDSLTYPVISTAVLDKQTSCDEVNFPNGRIQAETTTGGYDFEWRVGVGSAGALIPNAKLANDSTTTAALVSGDYTVIVTNTTTSCFGTQTITLPDNIVLPSLTLSESNPVTVCNDPNGEITATPVGLTSNASGDYKLYYLNQNTLNPNTIKTHADAFMSDSDTALVYSNINDGYYASLVRDSITHCESQPVVVYVSDDTDASIINIDAIVAATFCDDEDGSVNISITSVGSSVGPYTIEWFEGGPINAPPFDFVGDANLPTFTDMTPMTRATAPPVGLTAPEDMWDLPVGVFTVVVTDANGCGTIRTESVPFQDAPVVTVTPTNSTKCLNHDGEIQLAVDVSGVAGATNYSYILHTGLDPATATYARGERCDNGLVDDDGDGFADMADSDCNTSYNGLPGGYDFTYTDLDPSGYVIEIFDHTADCAMYLSTTIETDALTPLVNLGAITANTACDTEDYASATVTLTVSEDPRDPSADPASYDIVSITAATATPATDNTQWPINTIPFNTATKLFENIYPTLPVGFRDGGFGPQTYNIQLRNNTTECVVEQFVTFPDQPDIPQVIEVSVSPETFCAPIAGNGTGSAEVETVSPIDVEDYHYYWADDNAFTSVIYSDDGVTDGGEILNASKLATPADWFNADPKIGPGNQTYYVRGERLPGTGPGAGCFTPIVQVNIQDQHITPVPEISLVPNTSCDPAVGEGVIAIQISNDANVAHTYEFDLTGDATANETNQDGSVLLTPFTALLDGDYTVTTTNENTGCATENDVTLDRKDLTISITDNNLIHQLICDPYGEIEVTEITIDRTVTDSADLVYNAALTGDFDFAWYENDITNPQIEDDPNDPINDETLETGTGAGQFSSMGEGTYYVIATRKAGGTAPVLGLDCESLPFRVDIEDQHVNPVVTLTPFTNTSCNTNVYEGEIDVVVTDATDGSVGTSDFTYTWVSTTAATGLPTSMTTGLTNPYTGALESFDQLEEGAYEINVFNNLSGCQVTATTTILQNSTPVFVTTYDVTPQYMCTNDGEIIVTGIEYDYRGTNTNLVPADADFGNFIFTWTHTGSPAPATTTNTLDNTTYPDIERGTYTVFAKRTAGSPGRDCESAPVSIVIDDEREFPSVVLTPFSNTSCTTTAPEGKIEIDVTDHGSNIAGTQDYDYTWTAVDPVTLDLPTVDNAAQNGVNNRYPVATDPLTGLLEGEYKVRVTDNLSLCSIEATTIVPENQTPVFVTDATLEHQLICNPDGSITVTSVKYDDINLPPASNPVAGTLTDFEYEWFRNDITTSVAVTPGTTLDDTNYNYTGGDPTFPTTIGAGTYYVVAERMTGVPGAGCKSAPFRVDIEDQSVLPVVTLTPFSNTSCNTDFEGSIEVEVADGSDASVPRPFDYTYSWTTNAAAGEPASLDAGLTNPYDGNVAADGAFTELEEGDYEITVVNNQTGCEAIATTTIFKNQIPVFVAQVNANDQMICNPDGDLTVTAINLTIGGSTDPGDISQFVFDWYREDLTTQVGDDIGELLDGTTYVDPGTDPDIANIGAGTYYVIARRVTGSPGAGCESAPFRKDIEDKSITPIVTLTPSANTACNEDFEGAIEVIVTDATNPAVSATPFDYDYTWTIGAGALPAGLAPGNFDGSAQDFTQLEDGGYTITVLNNDTGCEGFASTTIIENQIPVFVTQVDANDQLICNPDGDLEVVDVEMTIGGTTTNGNIPDFSFDWYREDLTTLVGDSIGAILDETTYNYTGADPDLADIGTGTYFVVATRVSGAPGAGCESAPFRKDIENKSITPIVTLTPSANTACNEDFEGAIEVNVTDATDPAVSATPFDYDYTWTIGAGALPAGLAPGNFDGTAENFTQLEDGDYTITVLNNDTGCEGFASTTIIENQIPVFVTQVDANDQLICNPDGDLEVVDVEMTIGGATTNGNIADFSFDWYREDLTTLVGDSIGAVLDGTTYNYTGVDPDLTNIGAGTYFVVAQRVSGAPGAGCESAPFRKEIRNQSVVPIVTLTPLSNTSCNNDFEGSIEVSVSDETDASVSRPFNYTYSWTTTATAGLPVSLAGGLANPYNGNGNSFTQLEDGVYEITVVNNLTGCETVANTTITENQIPVFVAQVDPAHQLICNPDGSLTVSSVNLNIGGVSTPGSVADFSFDWYRNNLTTQVGNDIGPLLNATTYVDPLTTADVVTIGAGTYFVVATRVSGTPGAGCQSVPFREDIKNLSVTPIITLSPSSNTSCNNDFEGAIEVNIADATDGTVSRPFNYDYVWTTDAATGLPVSMGAGLTNPYTGAGDNFTQLEDGDYELSIVNNNTGCEAVATTTITENQIPVFVAQVDPEHQLICNPAGSLTVSSVNLNINGVSTPGAVGDFTFDWFRNDMTTQVGNDMGPLLDGTTYVDPATTADVATIGAGTYFVVATRVSGAPGAGCQSVPFREDIFDQSVVPVITLTPLSNTSCDDAFEGSIEVNIVDGTNPSVTRPFNFDYTWTTDAVGGLPANLDAGLTNPYNGSANNFTQLEDGGYTLAAINNQTGCDAVATTTIIKNQTPVFTQQVAMIPQLYCGPSGNLNVEAVEFQDRDGNTFTANLNEFAYTWMRGTVEDTIATIDATVAQPIAGYVGTELDSAIYSTIGTDTYFVVATRLIGGPGSGCSSAPFKVDITDERDYPVITFETIANTSCDNNYDGRIIVNTSTGSAPGAGANYDLTWVTPLPAGTSLTDATNIGSTYTTPGTDVIGPFTYSATLRNRVTNCEATGSVTLFSNPQPLEILSVSSTDQMICYADGSITVTGVEPATTANYTFTWHENDPTSPAIEEAGLPVTTAVLDNTTYSLMKSGTYYVVATRTAIGPGSGCSTPPFEVFVNDLHTDPEVTFTPTANSACDPSLSNGIIVAKPLEVDGTTDNYDFSWLFNGAILRPTTTGTADTVTSALNGAYVLTTTNLITGCPVTKNIDLLLDTVRSTPNIIDVETIDPVNCFPTATAEVTKITLGSTGNSVLQPPLTPPDNQITDTTTLSTFDYEWFYGGVDPEDQLPGGSSPAYTARRISSLVPGSYFVRVKDPSTACVSSPKEFAIYDSLIVYPEVEVRQSQPQVACDPSLFSGELIAVADIGKTPNSRDNYSNYTFFWFDEVGTAINTTSDSLLTDRGPGYYEITVQDLTTNCSKELFYIIEDESDKFRPEISISIDPRMHCLDPDGQMIVREVGYDPNSNYPYPPNYVAERFTPGNPVGETLPFIPGFQLNWQATGLDTTTYIIKITDLNTRCEVTDTATIPEAFVYPEVTVNLDNPLTNCDVTRPNGQFTALASGTFVGYNFAWLHEGDTIGRNHILSGLAADIYTVSVTNQINMCTTLENGEIVEDFVFPPTPLAVTKRHMEHCIEPDGWVSATVEGITFGYTFNWYTGMDDSGTPDPSTDKPDYIGLENGIYAVTARDLITGCVSQPDTALVRDLRVFPELFFQTTASYCDELPDSEGGNGTITLQLMPADVITDEVEWTLMETEEDNQPVGSVVGVGTYITNLFPGEYRADVVTSKGCEAQGFAIVPTEILNYQLVTNNNDGKNDKWQIDCISRFKNNNVKIFNRSGVMVYEADGYNNDDVVFTGKGEKGVYTGGNDLPVGTYFFIIDKRDGSKPKTGYIELVK